MAVRLKLLSFLSGLIELEFEIQIYSLERKWLLKGAIGASLIKQWRNADTICLVQSSGDWCVSAAHSEHTFS